VLTEPESTATTVANESREEPLFLERFMDFNPCASVLACPAPYITVFKTRICSECGRNCHKMTGYVREIRASTDDARGGTTTKVYFHKACARKREDRKHHKANGFGSVLVQLGEHFREIEREAEREAERKRREEALSKASAEKEAAAAAKPGTAGARNPPQGATPGEDAPPGGFLRRVGKAISKTTREMASAVRTLRTGTSSWKPCHGKSGTTGAAEESAFRGHEF